MNSTFLPASLVITQLPTRGAKVFGSRPAVSVASDDVKPSLGSWEADEPGFVAG
jgi:hypothetical protein